MADRKFNVTINMSAIPTGTAPLIVTSTTLVTNLNADLLDGQQGAWYQDWRNVLYGPQFPGSLILKGNFEDGGLGLWNGNTNPTVVAVTGQSWTKALQTTNRDNYDSGIFSPVVPGERFYCRTWVDNSGSAYPAQIGMRVRDSAGTSTWVSAAQIAAGAIGTIGGWLTIPATAVSGMPWVQMTMTAGTAGQATLWANLWCARSLPSGDADTLDGVDSQYFRNLGCMGF